MSREILRSLAHVPALPSCNLHVTLICITTNINLGEVMTPHDKVSAETMGFPSLINWDDDEDAQVGASFAQLAELLETKGSTCSICGLPINKRKHPWNKKHG